jgi:hypothetical protein
MCRFVRPCHTNGWQNRTWVVDGHGSSYLLIIAKASRTGTSEILMNPS